MSRDLTLEGQAVVQQFNKLPAKSFPDDEIWVKLFTWMEKTELRFRSLNDSLEKKNPAHSCFNCEEYLGHRGFCSKKCHDEWYDSVNWQHEDEIVEEDEDEL